MIKSIYQLIASLFVISGTINGQTILDDIKFSMNVSINMPSYFEPSDNDVLTYVTQLSKEDTMTIYRTYRIVRASGPTAFPSLFGMVTSIIRHKSGEYVIFVLALPGRGDDAWGDIKTDSSKIYTLNEVLPFTRIRHDFNYGATFTGGSLADIYALDQMITHYPRERAKDLFNAESMVVYPFDLEGNVYEDKYGVCRAVAVERDGQSLFLYYMMTNDNFLNFDTFLNDIKGVFWFNDGPPPPRPERPQRKNKVSYKSITIDLNSDIPPSNLNDFFVQNFKYPKGKTTKGIVIVDFVVNTSGNPEQFDVIQSLDKDFDAEVLRVLKKMPDWTPAISFDKLVESQHTITVRINEKGASIRGIDEAEW